MKKKKIVKIVAQLEIPYYEYSTKRLNREAVADIVHWVKETLKEECSSIPLYVEQDENGSAAEDYTEAATVKVRLADD